MYPAFLILSGRRVPSERSSPRIKIVPSSNNSSFGANLTFVLGLFACIAKLPKKKGIVRTEPAYHKTNYVFHDFNFQLKKVRRKKDGLHKKNKNLLRDCLYEKIWIWGITLPKTPLEQLLTKSTKIKKSIHSSSCWVLTEKQKLDLSWQEKIIVIFNCKSFLDAVHLAKCCFCCCQECSFGTNVSQINWSFLCSPFERNFDLQNSRWMSQSGVCPSVNNNGEHLHWKFATYDELSFLFGWISVVSWTFALLPQIISNCVHQSAESQSFWFWLLWLVGDVCNLIGCVLTDNLVTNIALALVYLGFTAVAFVQFVCYEFCLPKMKAARVNANENARALYSPFYQSPSQQMETAKPNMTPVLKMALQIAHQSPRMFNVDINLSPQARNELNHLLNEKDPSNVKKPPHSNKRRVVMTRLVVPGREDRQVNSDILTSINDARTFASNDSSSTLPGDKTILQTKRIQGRRTFSIGTLFVWFNSFNAVVSDATQTQAQTQTQTHMTSILDKIGLILGWMCTFIYISSRIPQLKLMLTTRKVQGLNPLFFYLTLTGNFTQCISMLIMPDIYHHSSTLITMLPWLLSSSICMFQDSLILFLLYWFKGVMRSSKTKGYEPEEEYTQLTANYGSCDQTAALFTEEK
ncbi:hypothetical protein RFI_01875 [Reticulomyxa filosa]|uniref:Uncharacterized protein n=1 Tax=Reticulomyxa filosa TaxID=46433 RepID=X6PAM1_RETFI|nr:hypothetical protein RFI_01875 [Reticulomyxa filosa]|eukprot:ETO35201.1 hypothetical protein RFI_01875 [Reticulomyxa filosa]